MIRIGTHNGPFHADDAVGVAILSMVNAGEEIEIVRSRDPKVWETCFALVDVGDVHDRAQRRYDHHQRGGAGKRDNGVPLSSAGLVWAAYGRYLCALLDHDFEGRNDEVVDLVDRSFIQAVDALDSGYGTREIAAGVEHATFSGMIAALNPTFREPQDFDAKFAIAVERAKEVLEREIATARATVLARKLVEGQDGEIVMIDSDAPVMELLAKDFPNAKYLIFPSPGGEWMVQCVPFPNDIYSQRRPLPESWKGLRYEALAAVTGVADSVFAHNLRFICGAATKEGALALAKLALA